MSAIQHAMKRALTQAPKAARSMQTSTARCSGDHGHSTGGYDDYIHAEHMYNITAMKNRKIKMALGTVFLVGAGVAIPAWAVHWTQAKRMA